MKKAKLALTAVAVFAVVGGALAFKASRGNIVTLYTSTLNGGVPTCSTANFADATTAAIGVITTTIHSATTKLGDPCDKDVVLRRSL